MSEEILLHEANAFMPVMEIRQAVERFRMLASFVQNVMKEEIDYGTIPGTSKKTLLKPGAEKLTSLFGLSCHFQITKEIEDWTGEYFEGEPFFYYRVRCQLWRSELLIAEADGSCNSRESRYRWRWVPEGQLPSHLDKETLATRGGTISEFAFAVENAETTGAYGKAQAYWDSWHEAIASGKARATQKKARSGKVYDAWEMDATTYRVLNEDIASQVNTILKIAEKRALVAAVLIAVNASEYFTQDLEDLTWVRE